MLRTLTVILTISATAHCLANPPAVQDAPATRTVSSLAMQARCTLTILGYICFESHKPIL